MSTEGKRDLRKRPIYIVTALARGLQKRSIYIATALARACTLLSPADALSAAKGPGMLDSCIDLAQGEEELVVWCGGGEEVLCVACLLGACLCASTAIHGGVRGGN